MISHEKSSCKSYCESLVCEKSLLSCGFQDSIIVFGFHQFEYDVFRHIFFWDFSTWNLLSCLDVSIDDSHSPSFEDFLPLFLQIFFCSFLPLTSFRDHDYIMPVSKLGVFHRLVLFIYLLFFFSLFFFRLNHHKWPIFKYNDSFVHMFTSLFSPSSGFFILVVFSIPHFLFISLHNFYLFIFHIWRENILIFFF